MGRNMLVEGEWKTEVEPYTDEDGAFDRAETSFRDWIRDEGYFQGEITPIGPDLDYETPHDRDRFPGNVPPVTSTR